MLSGNQNPNSQKLVAGHSFALTTGEGLAYPYPMSGGAPPARVAGASREGACVVLGSSGSPSIIYFASERIFLLTGMYAQRIYVA
jgi:hypothetical protein